MGEEIKGVEAKYKDNEQEMDQLKNELEELRAASEAQRKELEEFWVGFTAEKKELKEDY